MSTEELLFPRYKVIAPWPGMPAEPIHLGQVITLQPYEDEDYKGFIHIPIKHIPGGFMREGFFSGYPHLFKKMHWSEERGGDLTWLPEYIIFSKDYCNFKKGQVYKTENWNKQHDAAGFCIGFITGSGKYDKCAVPASCGIQPATLAEYEQYINQKEEQ